MPQDSNHAYRFPLRYRDFCVFWTGSLLSGIGSQFTTVAMAWQLYELTDSAFQVGLLGLARAVPQMGLLLVAGLLADAMDRRKLMMCTDIGLFGVSMTLALLTLAGKASPGLLYTATALLAIFNSLETPARQSIIPNLVPREELAQTLALQGTQRYVPIIAGPSLAGVVLALFGPAACYMIDAFSWLAMSLSLTLLRTKLPSGKGWQAVSFRSLHEGLQFVWGHGVIFPLMVLDFGATFFGNARALYPIYARDILFVGPTGLGVLYAARAVGSLFSATAITFFGPVRRGGRWIFVGVMVYGISTVLFSGSQVFWFSVLMLALSGAGDTISAILRTTINQLSTPDELRGRMSSINSIFTTSGPQLGQFESGVVAAWLGAELSAMTGGLATLIILAGVLAAFPKIRQFQIGDDAPRSNISS
jgi:MFS family permease